MADDSNIVKGLQVYPKLHCFKVPDGYFELLHAATMLKVSPLGAPKSSFTLPENYFDSLSSSIAQRITSPLPETAENPFAVPPSYFTNLYVNVADRIHQPERKAAWLPTSVLRPALVLAASVVIGAVVAWPLLNDNSTTQQPKTLAKAIEKTVVPVIAPTTKKVEPIDAVKQPVSNTKPFVEPTKEQVTSPQTVTPNYNTSDFEDFESTASIEDVITEPTNNLNDNGVAELMAVENIDLEEVVALR